jgi:hypothetical protein
MKRPIGLNILAGLLLFAYGYIAYINWTVLKIYGVGSPRRNIYAVLELLVFLFVWLGNNYARWFYIAIQIWLIGQSIYRYFTTRPTFYGVTFGRISGSVAAACIIAYLCTPRVRMWCLNRQRS